MHATTVKKHLNKELEPVFLRASYLSMIFFLINNFPYIVPEWTSRVPRLQNLCVKQELEKPPSPLPVHKHQNGY